MQYAQWLKTVSDRSLAMLWVRYCGPSEINWQSSRDVERAYLIDNEMTERGLL